MTRQLFEYDPVIAYKFVPGLKARIPHEGGGYFVSTNESGFRCDRNFASQKPAGIRRILLFGDSFTAGESVSNHQRYGDLLEKRIANLEVYNFALPGTGTDQHYLIYREYAQGIEHDLLVIAVLVENIRRVVARYRLYGNESGELFTYAKPYFELAEGKLILRSARPSRDPIAMDQLPSQARKHVDVGGRFPQLRKLIKKLNLQDVTQRLTRYQPLPEYNLPHHPAWILMSRILEEWGRNHSKPVLLVPLPLYQHVEETCDARPYQARFRELATALGCALHDPLQDLLAYPPEQRRKFRFQTDIHLTPAGHVAVANSLAPAVERLLSTGTERATEKTEKEEAPR